MNILFNHRFVTPILDGRKIHTIRKNYNFWKRASGKICSIRVWEGKAYRSKQKELGKRSVFVEPLWMEFDNKKTPHFYVLGGDEIDIKRLAAHDGFKNKIDFIKFFANWSEGKIAVLHFTGYRY